MGTFFDRYARLHFEEGGESNWSRLDTIDFSSSWKALGLKFSVDIYAAANDANKANISVCGMLPERIKEWIHYLSITDTHHRLVLEAGYRDISSLTHVFTGCIARAIPTQPPDVWLNCDCVYAADLEESNVTFSTCDELSIRDIYEYASTWNGKSLLWKVANGKTNSLKFKGFSYNGSRGNNLIEELNRMCPAVKSYLDPVTHTWVAVDRVNPVNIAEPVMISKETGLIGIPEPKNARTVEFDVFLNPSIRKDQHVILHSEAFQGVVDGEYQVVSVKHSGDLRGSEWKTHLECINPQMEG